MPNILWMVLFLHRGEADAVCGNSSWHMNTRCGIWISSAEESEIIFEKKASVSILFFRGSNTEYLYDEFMKRGTPVFDDKQIDHYKHILKDIMENSTGFSLHWEYQTSERINHLLTYLIWMTSLTSEKKQTADDTARKVLNYLHSNLNKNMTIDLLADYAGISKYHLIRLFKKETGFTPIDYLNTLKVSRAKILLQRTTMTVTAISHSVGISDEKYFSRLFKNHTGLSPNQYRKSFLK